MRDADGHRHEHVGEHEHAGSFGTDAVLDIGGDIGALILITGPELLGTEVEVSGIDAGDRRIHTAIHERRAGDRVTFAGIFPQLPAGTYRILTDRADVVDRVTIVGGEVAQVDWTIEG